MIKEADRAWVAGVLDLRSMTFQVTTKKSARKYLELQVSTYDSRIAERLCRLSGRTFHPGKDREPKEWMQKSCAEHCKSSHVEYEVWRPIHRWQVRGTTAAIIMWNVLPYMVHKDLGYRELITDVFRQTPYHGKPGNAPRAAIRRLKQLGWTIPPQICDIVE